ncbi:hypothetical protein C487_01921 [Natrinema pallidum DSM 3751]|uniref:Uncharacterized protein n=1 Tax=Natrinema pallidum DSM 3751 TaxID=1227495 RepID=L9Z8Z7_9EURY|nr:hypothetical protein C487_01921 [Natrinema pallidum DSM 3751]
MFNDWLSAGWVCIFVFSHIYLNIGYLFGGLGIEAVILVLLFVGSDTPLIYLCILKRNIPVFVGPVIPL